MKKPIFGKDIQVGDIIVVGRGMQGTVLEKLYVDSSGHNFRLDIGQLSFLSGGVVGLVYRPTTQTRHQLLGAIDAAAERVRQVLRKDGEQHTVDHLADPEAAIAALDEAVEAYELSKPPRKEDWWQSRLGPANL